MSIEGLHKDSMYVSRAWITWCKNAVESRLITIRQMPRDFFVFSDSAIHHLFSTSAQFNQVISGFFNGLLDIVSATISKENWGQNFIRIEKHVFPIEYLIF